MQSMEVLLMIASLSLSLSLSLSHARARGRTNKPCWKTNCFRSDPSSSSLSFSVSLHRCQCRSLYTPFVTHPLHPSVTPICSWHGSHYETITKLCMPARARTHTHTHTHKHTHTHAHAQIHPRTENEYLAQSTPPRITYHAVSNTNTHTHPKAPPRVAQQQNPEPRTRILTGEARVWE